MQKQNRRNFVKSTAATTLAFNLLPDTARGANSRVALGCVGIGGKGAQDSRGVADAGAEMVAFCDVASPSNPKLARKKNKSDLVNKFPDAKIFEDYREMIRSTDIDAVTVSTPDHSHFHATVTALQKKCHVYCQKPLTHSIWEARKMTELAARMGVKTQMGNQAHAGEPIRRGVELIRAGIIGKVKRVHTWTNRPIWPQGIKEWPESKTVPEGLNWDLWIGPAPMREYNPEIAPFKWRGYWDFGTGALGDMACHIMDMPFWALNLASPTRVLARQEGNTDISGPNASVIDYRFPGNEYTTDELQFIWYDGFNTPYTGKMRPPDELWKNDFPTANHVFRRFDMILEGEKGKMYFGRNREDWVIKPEGTLDGFKEPEKTLPRAPKGPYQEFLDAIRNDGVALSHFAHSGPFTETVLLGNLAVRLGKEIKWDAKNLKVKGVPEADALIRRAYRKGWEIEV
jgi:predicted dehydrogenase